MCKFDLLKDIIDQQLTLAGYSIDAEEYSNGFGSYYVIYSRDNHQVRFVYDGRDNIRFIEHSNTGSQTWEQVGTPIGACSEDEMARLANTEWLSKLLTIIDQERRL